MQRPPLPPSPNKSSPIAIQARSASSSDDELVSSASGGRCPLSDEAQPKMKRNHSNLDLTGAFISESESADLDEPYRDQSESHPTPSIGLPQQTVNDVSHFAIDLGGSLIKLVYFSQEGGRSARDQRTAGCGGQLHFKKWETKNYMDCIAYIARKRLHKSEGGKVVTVKATGGGAYKFQEEFRKQLDLQLDKQDEMRCLVAGSDFFLQAIEDEVFTFQRGEKQYASFREQSMYPYLLVNIGSGVSMLKVTGEGEYERISGTNVGGGTFWGLCRLLTGVKSFDEMLKMSAKGNNTAVDMLVGDIYGGNDYSKVGLAATTIASSFGKVVMDDSSSVADYKPEDIALSLLRMISYNIAQVAVLNAMNFKLKRLIFGGFFIRGHAYTMETMSYAIHYWSKGEYKAMFMRHEGFLGALGAFLQNPTDISRTLTQAVSSKDATWVEKFIRVARSNGSSGVLGAVNPKPQLSPCRNLRSDSPGLGDGNGVKSEVFNLGVLHLVPSLKMFPLLATPAKYQADTINMQDAEERAYWIDIFKKHQPSLMSKAIASAQALCDNTETEAATASRAEAFNVAFHAHLQRLESDPSAFGRCSLASIFEFREECLRDFGFKDSYLPEKDRENSAALEALPDLLAELDKMDPDDRLLALVEGMLAGNIFDWGSNACVELYQNDAILEMYRKARADLRRPWIVDDFEILKQKFCAMYGGGGYTKALILLDNSGADAVLGVIPFARELVRMGVKVVLSSNSLPALNDITAPELVKVMDTAATMDAIIANALASGMMSIVANGSGSPCINLRLVSEELAQASSECDLLILEGMGRAIHTNLDALFTCDCIKLAMVKNQRVAETLFKGNLYDCMCKFQPAVIAAIE